MSDAATLVSQAKCYACYAGGDVSSLIELVLLANILTSIDSMADTTPQALLTATKCYNCYGASQAQLLKLGLLMQISEQIGGVGQILEGDGPPTSPPDNPLRGAIYTDRLTGVLYPWNVQDQAWMT